MAIVVAEPIISDPFSGPSRHYRSVRGEAELVKRRRPSGYTSGLRTRGGQTSMLEDEYVELPIVNEIRRHVAGWRDAGYPGATRTTLDLLRHWQRAERDRRLFFCQLEAAETAIWLIEGPQQDRVVATALEQQEAYTRHCLKMATGSGKTIVMGMLIAWSLLNKARQPTDRRFSDAVLVVCPNLTVKERLRILKPAEADNVYEAFDLVPPGTAAALHSGRIMVTNWHAFAVADDSRRRGVVQRGRESATAFANRRLKAELGSKGNLLVINDEAHHAWRQAPAEDTNGAAAAGSMEAATSVSDEQEEARIWLEGLALIHRARGVNGSSGNRRAPDRDAHSRPLHRCRVPVRARARRPRGRARSRRADGSRTVDRPALTPIYRSDRAGAASRAGYGRSIGNRHARAAPGGASHAQP